MDNYKASEAQFWFEVGGQPPETFQLVEFYGNEAISQLFHFEVKLISPIDYDLKLADFLNQPAKLIITRADEKKEIHGMLSHLEETGRSKDFAQYNGHFVPRMWRLSLFYQSRVFQNMSVPDIIGEVLKTAGFGKDDHQILLGKTCNPREYCVQYRETDLNFVSRLMEYEGIYFYFDHANGKDVITIVDERSKSPKIDPPDEINSHVGEAFETEEEETVHELVRQEKVVTGKVVLKDYNYRTPEVNLSCQAQVDSQSPGLFYEYGEHFKNANEGTALAEIRKEEIACSRRTIVGASDCRGFHAGYKFTLANHYRKSLNGDYLLTQLSHSGSQAAGIGVAGGAGGTGPSYHNEFTCIPADVRYRPPRITPEPHIPGVMTARVESAGGQYAFIDEEGRYKVRMPFDMASSGQAKASRSIRLAQPYTGSGYGMHFPVDAGTELVWACIDGNVDRPLGLASVPNPSRSSPVVAQNKSQNIIRTASGNEMVMDDMKNQAQISLRTAEGHNLLLDDKDDKVEIVTTQKHLVLMDDKNRNISVQTTNGHLLILDDSNTKIVIQSKNGHRIVIDDKTGSEKITIADKKDENRFVMDITNKKLELFTKNGSIDIQAPNGTIDIKATTLKVETKGDSTFKSANTKIEAKQDYSVKATNIKEEATMDYKEKGMNVKSEASMEHKTKGMNVTSEAGVNMQVKGTMVTVQSSGPNTIKGMPVLIN
jgi:type VI secretion system secreted protein VgrG